jgi:hypothetical protein
MKPHELKTITALEKLTGKKQFAEIMAGCIDKPPGKPTLVTEDDKRPPMAITKAEKTDFDDSLLSE